VFTINKLAKSSAPTSKQIGQVVLGQDGDKNAGYQIHRSNNLEYYVTGSTWKE